jgi:hypothetical protein
MQSISVYLYSNSLEVFTNAQAAWKTERYRRVYNRNIKIFRGVDNRIDLQIKNSDERRAEISTASVVVFNLIEREGQKIVLQKDCETVSASTGRFYVEVTEAELLDIEPGFYQYSTILETRTDRGDQTYVVSGKNPLYIDSQYDAMATIEIIGSLLGEVQPSTEVKEFAFRPSFDNSFQDFYISSIISARPRSTNPQTLHTFQFNCTEYSGTVSIEASISESSDPDDWVDVNTQIIDNENIFYTNVIGKYNWFRVKHTPDSSTAVAEFTIAQTLLGFYTVDIRNAGQGYAVGNAITIQGGRLGGETGTNDLVITVVTVDSNGAITAISSTGLSYNGVKTFVLSGPLNQSGTIDKILYR